MSWHRQVPHFNVWLSDDVEFRAIGIAGDVLVAVFGNDQNIMLTIPASAGFTCHEAVRFART